MSEELNPNYTETMPPSTGDLSLPDPEGGSTYSPSAPSTTPSLPSTPSSMFTFPTPTLSQAQDLLKKVADVTGSPMSNPEPYGTQGESRLSGRRIIIPDELLKSPTMSVKVEDELEEAQRIRNTDALQDVFLKRVTLLVLFFFLAMETTAIFSFAFFQGTKLYGFQLEEWSFNLLLTATILQITFMIQVAVRYLFNGNGQ